MDTYIVVTPSNIEVEYRLANAGSRLAAFIVDTLLQLAAIALLAAVVLFGVAGYRFDTLGEVGGPALAFVIAAAFAIQSGYFIVCELTMNGCTVGKRLFNLRVIRDNGLPLSLTESLVRNLLRTAVDMLYVGVFIILFNKRHKRLGDMAAGTIVVSEHPRPAPPAPVLGAALPGFTPARPLNDAERYLVHEYLRRRDSLPDGGAAIKAQLEGYLGEV